MSEIKTTDLNVFYAQKSGMTRIFNEDGSSTPVTVLKLVPNKISQIKTEDKEGYNAYQIAFYQKREKLITNAAKGHLKKAGIDESFKRFAEVRVDEVSEDSVGTTLGLGEFAVDSFVDICGDSKGKGFQGVMKRYGFSGGPASHGSHFHRTPGSIGNRATPGKVFKNKKLPGHMGAKTVTTQNLKIVAVNEEKGYMLIKGSVPGAKNGFVRVQKAQKRS